MKIFRPHRLAALVAAAILGVAAARADDAPPPIANPSLLPSSVLTLRGPEKDKAQLRLSFERTRDGDTVSPLKVWIGADYFALFEGTRETIYDLRLRRRFVVDQAAGSMTNFSLYGDVIFRQIELTRRIELEKALHQDPEQTNIPESLDPFWIESEVGLVIPGAPPDKIERHDRGDGIAVFLYRGAEVAMFKAGSHEVPSALRHSFGAFLRHALPIHPAIAAAVSETGSVPAELDFISEAKGQMQAVAWRLDQAEAKSDDFPLSGGLSLQLLPAGGDDANVALLRQVLNSMIEALAGRADQGPRPVAVYRAEIDSALKDNRRFEAALLLTELALQWGRGAAACDPDDKDAAAQGPCHSKAEIDKLMSADPRAVAMFQAMGLQTRDPDKALVMWRTIERSDVADRYVVDIFLARLLSVRGEREEASWSFAAAFAGNAYIPTLYRDLGDHFARGERTDLAWFCYDLGRALPNRAEADALSNIDELERKLVEQFPELF
jgi:hypothetical protein